MSNRERWERVGILVDGALNVYRDDYTDKVLTKIRKEVDAALRTPDSAPDGALDVDEAQEPLPMERTKLRGRLAPDGVEGRGRAIRYEDGHPHESHRWVGGGEYGGSPPWVCADCGVDIEDDEAVDPCTGALKGLRDEVREAAYICENDPQAKAVMFAGLLDRVDAALASPPDSEGEERSFAGTLKVTGAATFDTGPHPEFSARGDEIRAPTTGGGDGLDHKSYTMAAIHEREGCPDGAGCRYCDTDSGGGEREALEDLADQWERWASFSNMPSTYAECAQELRDALAALATEPATDPLLVEDFWNQRDAKKALRDLSAYKEGWQAAMDSLRSTTGTDVHLQAEPATPREPEREPDAWKVEHRDGRWLNPVNRRSAEHYAVQGWATGRIRPVWYGAETLGDPIAVQPPTEGEGGEDG